VAPRNRTSATEGTARELVGCGLHVPWGIEKEEQSPKKRVGGVGGGGGGEKRVSQKVRWRGKTSEEASRSFEKSCVPYPVDPRHQGEGQESRGPLSKKGKGADSPWQLRSPYSGIALKKIVGGRNLYWEGEQVAIDRTKPLKRPEEKKKNLAMCKEKESRTWAFGGKGVHRKKKKGAEGPGEGLRRTDSLIRKTGTRVEGKMLHDHGERQFPVV